MENIKDIIEKSRRAQAEWALLPYKQRAGRLKNAYRAMAAMKEEIAQTICRETSKLAIDALAAEIIPAIMAFPYYIKAGRRIIKPRKIHGGNPLLFNKKSTLVYEPWGVTAIITPWNYPFAIPLSETVTALLAGNSVILKTASVTPGCGRMIGAVMEAADLPAGLFTVIEMPGAEAGPALINSGVDKLFFTGSAKTGKELMSLAAARLLPLCLELGGADAAIVRCDADIDRAVWGIIWAGFSNAGQSCGGVQRVFVRREIYEEFLAKLKQCVETLEPGSSIPGDSFVNRANSAVSQQNFFAGLGPMISLKQKEEVKNQVNQCLALGAKIAAQSREGSNPEGSSLFYPATVLTDIKASMPVMNEEIFGPVIGVMPVDGDSEAVAAANNSSYGLTASVWSRDRGAAKKMAAKINTGAVTINDHLMSHGLAQTPWGGFGESGFGKTHGEAGFREMLRTKVVVDETLPGAVRDPWWQPYSPEVYSGLNALGDFAGGPGIIKRIRAVPGLVKFFLRTWKKDI
ncbi:MAG: aldehyde dehydrogenase family protein [Treponema sp.]|nr:aldehyde dehydrogenase family protein [Treponema sp.]